jgi:mono/diheme cytochrome c family protein
MNISLKYVILCTITSLLVLENCTKEIPPPTETLPSGASKIEGSTQRAGDAAVGYNYLVTGDYISSGIPLDIFKLLVGTNSTEDLSRTGDNKGVPYNFNVVKAPNGVKVVVTNCLNCHADRINGQLVIGLGNNTADNTMDLAQQLNGTDFLVQSRYGKTSPEWVAYYPFSRGFRAIAPYIRTSVKGISSADKIFAALSAHRNKDDLTWLTTPQYPIPERVVPSDVPAWWILKKKKALFYNALGVGDFARVNMAAALVTLQDSAEARKIEAQFPHVEAYLNSIQAPKYPFNIDAALAQKGKILFTNNCAKCHGKYETTDNTYPNFLIDLNTIGTDAALANEYQNAPQYHTWYNQSWFSKNPNAGQLLPTRGYVAPPLDGVWATPPYLHNGSVPTLDDVLSSTQRPKYWSRTFDNKADFDAVKMGWKYKIETSKVDNNTYDTTIYGYGNAGHNYGDALSTDERKAVIEYLKTL